MGGYTVAHLEEIEEMDDGHCNASRGRRGGFVSRRLR